MKKLLLPIISLALISTVLSAIPVVTVPADNVLVNWTSDSVYQVTGDITIPLGDILNIRPCVTVEYR